MSEYLQPVIDQLIVLHGLDSKQEKIKRILSAISSESFSLKTDAYSSKLCRINGDGMPFQVCVSEGSKRGGLRLIIEGGPLQSSMENRVEAAKKIFFDMGQFFDFNPESDGIKSMVLDLLPKQKKDIDDLGGTIWFALGFTLASNTLKAYISLKWGELHERWLRAEYAIKHSSIPDSYVERWRFISNKWGKLINPVGFMIEPCHQNLKKIKLYVRVSGMILDNLREALVDFDPTFNANAFFSLSKIITPDLFSQPNVSIVISQELDAIDPANSGIKIDVGCMYAPADDAIFYDRIITAMDIFKLDTFAYRQTYNILTKLDPVSGFGKTGRHQFFGLGYSPREGFRINIYLKPLLPQRLISSEKNSQLHCFNRSTRYVEQS